MRLFVYEHVSASPAHAFPASLRAEGRAMLDAIAEDFGRVPDVEVVTVADCDEHAFRERARAADFTFVVAPEFDQLLRTLCRWVEEAGGRLLGPSSAAIALTGDKLLLARHLTAHGIRTPATTPLTGCDLPFAFPVVVKPRFGAGSQATYLLRSREAAAERLPGTRSATASRLTEDKIVQPFVPGFAASVAFLIGPQQYVALAPAAQHLSDDGEFHYLGGAVPLPNDLAERAARVARRALAVIDGLCGYVGVDVVLGGEPDGGDDWVIEINPRLTTSYLGLRRLARTNLAESMLRIAMGKEAEPVTWRDGVVEWRADGTIV
jgi:predicted ATP-grasp superfamily ATP-dependent carboligase